MRASKLFFYNKIKFINYQNWSYKIYYCDQEKNYSKTKMS